jgi:chemotaxis protein methyltransferase CheR
MELPRLKNKDFEKLSHLIYTDYGIKMPMSKKVMLEGRLRKRLKANNLETYAQYCDFLFSKAGMAKEVVHMIDVVSTNKTDFFRESAHFNYMNDVLLPEYLEKNNGKPLQLWSSASSTGEEPYSMAITIEEFLKKRKLFEYSIHCTDISTQVLEKGVQGIYDEGRVVNIPLKIKQQYFLKGKDENRKLVRVIPNLRKKLTFDRLNLMDSSYDTPNDYDIIFCRNVLIYFDKATQERVINKLCERLKPGGIFFLGHSESIAGITVPLQTIKPTIFRKI